MFFQVLTRSYGWGIANKGVSFGVGEGIPILLLISVFVVALYWYKKRRNNAILLILVGGGVNLVSRLGWGSVWDYVPMLGLWNNMADMMIFIGASTLVFSL